MSAEYPCQSIRFVEGGERIGRVQILSRNDAYEKLSQALVRHRLISWFRQSESIHCDKNPSTFFWKRLEKFSGYPENLKDEENRFRSRKISYTNMSNQEAQAYRHTWNGQHSFHYHRICVERNPPGAEVTFEPIALDDVPQSAECDFCYRPVYGSSEYQIESEPA